MAKTIMNIIYLANMLIVLSKIQFSLQLSGGVCKDKGKDLFVIADAKTIHEPHTTPRHSNYVCCYNFQNINDVCTECTVGTVSLQDGLCLPCNENKYGYKCLNECSCNHSQRCDAKVGCIMMTVTTTNTGNKEYSFISQNVTTNYLFRDNNTNSNEPSNIELIVYTLCVIGFLIIIGLSHFVRSYRQRSSINIPRKNRGEGIELRPVIVEPAYIEIYDEIDEHLIAEVNKEAAVKPQLRNINATVSNACIDKTTSSHDDTSSYLDPCFTLEEIDNKSSSKESSSSHSSNFDLVIPDHTGYLNPYQPLRERQLILDGYEVTVHVYKDSNTSSGSESSEEMSSSYKYSHVYQQLQKDQSTQNHEYEKATKTSNEMNINLSEKNEIHDCRNKVSKDIESIDLLNMKETDGIDNIKGQFNAHLFFGQTIGDACHEFSEKSLNEDNDDTDYTDKSLHTDTSQMLYAGEIEEHNEHVDILTDYLDMNNPINTCTGDILQTVISNI